VFEAGMTVCVESYIGAEGGRRRRQARAAGADRADGMQLLSPYPFEEELME
jgi:hypothetical protein